VLQSLEYACLPSYFFMMSFNTGGGGGRLGSFPSR
jgi:hypothetical protein